MPCDHAEFGRNAQYQCFKNMSSHNSLGQTRRYAENAECHKIERSPTINRERSLSENILADYGHYLT